ncbi:hypothetical protein A2276_08485 [candidate division WOR-1 bacterium RIFOXYA12_FULL_43_27]|uniref:Type II secretion system protein GspF domain-containing protein n=1 Tax=candidate division WOR-1 bacterium RIFOXYC2_FULL_46_14 TaxID=1802587 RepID=A0A1F4U6G4_UNCSA|nr:MAG: hypothetical protein A2276_08485 [candidate division WOR-1 bacterium RIFOXYA12_FULL_43_27]OGC20628.1 MAG: hypothetical protein A2292_06310 [candidate division WOR-1 bacterium RIFOXYB2_FULL_46_45]OGC31635.1 MAG: hypothetical protein A2232_05140 [candidate division WOR-1 bacterium RIFOXYA2_FULL_46_56]OGC40469.1 MAG: hypothetical protein A2438_04340 [candidate division WOR-1 bacterium RIFOXYC2_FULL_46_14]
MRGRFLSFYKQLLGLLSAGLPISKALSILNKKDIVASLENGITLSDSLRAAGFPAEDLALIGAGEQSGNLEDALGRVARRLEAEIVSRDKIKKALMYPTIVLSVSLVSIIFLLVFILPTFAGIFSEFDYELPLLTRLLLKVSNWWFLPIFFLFAIGLTAWKLFKSEAFKLKFPFYRNIILARLCRGLGYQLKSNVPILSALRMVAENLGSPVYSAALNSIARSLEQGSKFSDCLDNRSLFPAEFFEIIRVGEESGSLCEVLVQSALFYEEETENLARKWVTLVEPASTLVVGGVVGVIAFAMILPLFQMMESIK